MRVAIDWTATDGCRDADALRAAVAGHVATNRVVASGADVTIHGSSGRGSDGRWRASIRVEGHGATELGRRQLSEPGADCSRLDQTLVVVLAMMVDSSMVEPPPPPAGDGEQPRVVHAAPPARPHPRWAVAALAMTEVGRLPGTAIGAELVVTPPGPVELMANAWTEQEVALDRSRGSRFRQLAAAARVCPLRWRVLSACAGGQLGAIWARGYGFADNRDQRKLVADARIAVRLTLPLAGRWRLQAGAGAWIALIRPRFLYQNQAGETLELYRPAAVAGIAQLGLSAVFF